MINKFDEYHRLNEGGFSRLKNILTGYVPSVYSIGIITWENPNSEQASDEYNTDANSRLEYILRDGSFQLIDNNKFGYNKVKGMYGQTENSFIIRNISEKALCDLGNKGKQESVIFGERIDKNNIQDFDIKDKVKDDNYIGMNFKLINTENNKNYFVMGETNVIINRDNYDDLYTEYKGKRFLLPFYNTNINIDKEKKFILDNYDKVKELNLSNYKLDKEGKIPLTEEKLKEILNKSSKIHYAVIDEIYDDIYYLKNNKKRIMSYEDSYINSKGELVGNKEIQTQPQLEKYKDISIDDRIQIEKLSKKLSKQVGFNAYVNRNRIQEILRKYNS
jgi:hypothetical protein